MHRIGVIFWLWIWKHRFWNAHSTLLIPYYIILSMFVKFFSLGAETHIICAIIKSFFLEKAKIQEILHSIVKNVLWSFGHCLMEDGLFHKTMDSGSVDYFLQKFNFTKTFTTMILFMKEWLCMIMCVAYPFVTNRPHTGNGTIFG